MCVHLKKLKGITGDNTLHLTKSWGGENIGEIFTVTINNKEEILRIQIDKYQARELSEALNKVK